jgi:hypothetical protein
MQWLAQNPGALAVALKYSPLPLAASQEIANAFTGNGIPPEVQQQIQEGQQLIQQQAQQIEQMKNDRSIEAAKVQSQHEREQSKSQIEGFKAETERAAKLKDGPQGDGGTEMLMKLMEQRFEAMEAARERDHDLIMQHLKNAGQIAAARVRADASSDQGIETNDEVGA